MAHTEYNVPGQTNLATVNTFYLGKPAPIVAERIWDTKTKAEAYIHDTVGSALAGIILRVTDDTTNNGAYLVEKDISATNGLKLTKFVTGSDTNTWRNIKVKTSASGTATEILSTSSTLPLTLTADSNITLTAVQDTNNEYTGEIKISASGGGNDTWRNIYSGGTSRVGTGTDTKAINFAAGSNVTVSYEAAGTGTGQSGSADYFNIKIAADNDNTWRNIYVNNTLTINSGTDTKAINYKAGDGITISYEAAGTSTGQSGDLKYFNIKTTLNTAGNNTLGGIKLGYTQSGRNMPLETDSDKAYINTHTTNTNTVYIAGTNITLSTPTTTNYTLTSTDVYNDADANMFKVQLTSTVTTFNDDTIIKVRFPSNVISSKRLVFYTGTNASNNLVSCYNNDMYSTGTKWFYPSSNILHSDMYYYFIKKASPNGFVYLGTNVQSITASGGGSANDSTITLRGGNSTTYSTWSDNFTTNASSDKTIYVPVMTGATSGANGEMGLVPKPTTSDRTKFLCGDGTWQPASGSGSTVSITVPSPVPTIGTSDTTLATVTIDNAQTLIKAKISAAAGGFEPMEGYSLLSGSYSPLEFLCNFFYPVFLDSKSNDISGVTAVRIAEVVDDPADIDGHIPVGAIIIMYACYLTEIGCTSGRLILETYAYGDYWGYIVCQNDSDCYNVDSGSPSQFGSYDVLNENLVNLLTFNWNAYIGELPMGINDAVQGAAGLVSHNDEIIGGGPDGFYYYHKYIFTFSDIVTGTMYNSLKTNFYQNILAQDFEGAAKEISDNAGTKSGEYFDGMVVTLEHKSCTIADPTDGMHGKTFGWHQPSRPV